VHPVLAKVRYAEMGRIAADRAMMADALALNWVVGPAVMFALGAAPGPARLPHRGHPGPPGPLRRGLRGHLRPGPAGAVGPLIEVPILVELVYVALWAGCHFYPSEQKEAL
jgi:ACR3 family arsenite efflux pump ArsB